MFSCFEINRKYKGNLATGLYYSHLMFLQLIIATVFLSTESNFQLRQHFHVVTLFITIVYRMCNKRSWDHQAIAFLWLMTNLNNLNELIENWIKSAFTFCFALKINCSTCSHRGAHVPFHWPWLLCERLFFISILQNISNNNDNAKLHCFFLFSLHSFKPIMWFRCYKNWIPVKSLKYVSEML